MTSFEPGLKGKCPYCNTTSAKFTNVLGEAARDVSSGLHGYASVTLNGQFSTNTDKLQIVGAACPECGCIIVTIKTLRDALSVTQGYIVDDEFIVWPRYVTRPVAPEVTTHIADDYREAAAILNISPKSSAALSRRCLQSVLREAGKVNQYNLSDQIKAVLPALPLALQGQIDAIRIIGNFAAHPEKDQGTGLIIDVEPGEAEWNLDVLDMLFEHYYVQPAQIAQKKAALNAKLTASGKPTIP